MDFSNKKIGIWGFGIVGKSALNYLTHQGAQIAVFDRRALTHEEKDLITQHGCHYYAPEEFEQFIKDQDLILPSPGIDLRAFKHLPIITELDIFGSNFKSPIIAITGTLGKTTTTQLLSHILRSDSLRIAMGGNVGIGMLDLIERADEYDAAVLEVSSFQLELSTYFTPTLSLWTNFYPNHLDRHTTLQEYFNAKHNILVNQQPGSYALLPFEIIHQLTVPLNCTRAFFTSRNILESDIHKLASNDLLFFICDNQLVKYDAENYVQVMPTKDFAHITFQENEILIAAALHLLKIPVSLLSRAQQTFTVQEHRLEKITTHDGIDYYNDSKATISQATLAAVDKLQGKPIILLLGGLSKGVDRTKFFPLLKNKVVHIICFGQEARLLSDAAMREQIPCSTFETLEQAIDHTRTIAHPGNQVLFSPAGSSFDLFKNYQERGTAFKTLVMRYL